MIIKTERRDLKISDVSFKENGKPEDWQAYIPLKYSITVDSAKTRPDSAGPEKAKTKPAAGSPPPATRLEYRLKISAIPGGKDEKSGELTIKTNISERPELKIGGSIEAKKN